MWSLRQEHQAGEKIFVDWAGAKFRLYDREVGEIDSRFDLRSRARRQQLHVCACRAEPGSAQLDRLPRPRFRVYPGRSQVGHSG